MQELRYNPLLGTYTMVAAHRQNRPNMPVDWCPFCPGEGKHVPPDFDILVYPNDFPALSESPLAITKYNKLPYHNVPSRGFCDVILYSPQHHITISKLKDAHVCKLVKLWAQQTNKYAHDSRIKYIFPFENRGEAVGVTMPHPHGQLYAYPFIPLKIKTELQQCELHYRQYNTNLFDDVLATEISENHRTLIDGTYFWVGLPYFTDYPYGLFIIAKFPALYVHELTDDAILELAQMLKAVNGTFDALYGKLFPYMMCIHQGAVNDASLSDQKEFYRLHIEFYPPWRADNVIKYYASSEMGAWATANTVCVEDSILQLRQALTKYTNDSH
jgi:UDPglucose--hexose-1-phosphate uridylyltransferase